MSDCGDIQKADAPIFTGRRPATVERIDALLPQTQCGRCGFAGCRPYAEAIAAGQADVNQCPPGGEDGATRLARLLRVEPKPLDASRGMHTPPSVAVIDEDACIGCAQCLAPCPVDAIIGAPKHVHTVIAAWCTGCELCIAPCPVDCIAMRPLPARVGESKWQQRRRERKAADVSRARHAFHVFRLEREKQEQAAKHPLSAPARAAEAVGADPRRAAVQAALTRARAKQPSAMQGEQSDFPSVPSPCSSPTAGSE